MQYIYRFKWCRFIGYIGTDCLVRITHRFELETQQRISRTESTQAQKHDTDMNGGAKD